jgi:hypothetical protein
MAQRSTCYESLNDNLDRIPRPGFFDLNPPRTERYLIIEGENEFIHKLSAPA